MRGAIVGLIMLICGIAAPAAASANTAIPFHRGVNILGYDPYWSDPNKARFQWRHLREIRRAGFDHVRLNLFAFKYMDAAGRIDPAWLARLDRAVAESRKAGLGVILDEHDFNDCSDNVSACRSRLRAFWGQVAPRYRSLPRDIAFELLNEPHEALNTEWNSIFPELLAIVRKSNPNRWVVIGPTHWNSFRDLPGLQLPANDRNLIVTFHYYDPFFFTHQGASWTDRKDKLGVSWGSQDDRKQLRADFDQVAAWSRLNRRPILLGEFGAYDGSGTPIALRVDYTRSVAREAERQGFGWSYWQFDSDFIVWDMKRNRWFEPIRGALLPTR